MSEHFGTEFAKAHAEELRKFLIEARQHGCNYGEPCKKDPTTGKQWQEYSNGEWEYRDEWYGGEPYAGITTISHWGKVCWVMTYWGAIYDDIDLRQVIYDCLKAALRAFPEKAPWRGPERFEVENSLVYSNHSYGSIKKFYGTEYINAPMSQSSPVAISGLLYEMNYFGGFVDLK